MATELRRAAFAEVADAAARSDIPVLPVKGVLTSHLLYDRPEEREMVDIDVRVRPKDLERLCAAGRTRGWEPIEHSSAYAASAFKVLGERVEFESHVGPPGFCLLTVSAMLERATQHVEPFGVTHWQPELHDHALTLIVNAFKDQLVSATEGGLVDLARMANLPYFSFGVLASRAREAGIATMAWLVGEWMVERRGELQWRGLLDALGGPPHKLYCAAFRALAREGTPASFPLRCLVRLAQDHAGMRLNALSTTMAWWVETATTSPEFAVSRLVGSRPLRRRGSFF